MFSNLGLFGSTPCPDSACRRPSCLLSHAPSARSLDAGKLLGFQPIPSSVPAAGQGGMPLGGKKRDAEVPVGQLRQVRPKMQTAGGGSSSSSSSTSVPKVPKKASSGGDTSISSLRAQVKADARSSAAFGSRRESTAGGAPSARVNAVASSSKIPLDPPAKSSFLQKPAPSALSRAGGALSSSAKINASPKVTTTVVQNTAAPPSASSTRRPSAESSCSSRFVTSTARSSGFATRMPVNNPQAVSRRPNRPDPPAPRLNLLPSQTVVPLKNRNKGLDLLFKEYIKLYSALENSEGWEEVNRLAREHAIAQEEECYAKGGKTGYTNAITNTITAIRKRPPPTSASHPSVGLQSAYIKSLAALTESAASRLTKPIIDSLAHSPEELEKYGFMLDVPDGEGGAHPVEDGQHKQCDRCRAEFVVGEESSTKCWYHWGRARYGKEQGIRTQLATCCGVPWTNQGCTTSESHVFKETDASVLHDRVAFISSDDLPAPSATSRMDVVALDCEMLYTTGGLTLARVTLVDEDGKAVFDELVRPDPARVLDYNTRFSGIKPGQVEEAVMDLEAARAALGTLIGPETAIVGHGLENDLAALRLVHRRIIDTALLFPHPSGAPYRYALRDLMMKHLSKVIQNAGATGEGHSSLEDAAGSMELVRQQAKEMRERRGSGS